MTKDIKVKYDFNLRVLEYEGPSELLDSVLERISRSGLAVPANSSGRNSPKPPPKKAAPAKSNAPSAKAGDKPKKASTTKISSEKFDIYGTDDGVPKLETFFTEKKPGNTNAEKIAVIAYYITEILSEPSFSDGQIDFALKMLKIKRPTHLRQIITNTKNEKDWFEKFEDTPNWTLTRGGELFVNDELPRAE